jgi:hypothetical protein
LSNREYLKFAEIIGEVYLRAPGAGHELRKMLVTLVNKDGRDFWSKESASPVRDLCKTIPDFALDLLNRQMEVGTVGSQQDRWDCEDCEAYFVVKAFSELGERSCPLCDGELY